MSACALCDVRKVRDLGPCAACAKIVERKERIAIASAEPAPAESFDPMDVLETALRQTRAIQRRLQAEIDAGDVESGELVRQLASAARSIGQLVPTWQDLRAAELKKDEKLSPEEMEENMAFWFGKLPAAKQREVWQRLSRSMNEEKTPSMGVFR